jgi:GT2 family glycosyltransferase
LKDALDALVAQTFRDFEVLMVFNFAETETKAVVDQYESQLRMQRIHATGGLVEAANLAVKAANGEIFIRTDDDAVGSPHWLEGIHETFASSADIGGVTGPTTIPQANLDGRDLTLLYQRMDNGSLPWRLMGKLYKGWILEGKGNEVSRFLDSGAFTLGSNFVAARSLPGPLEVDHMEACNWAARTVLLRRIGGFDPAYLELGEYHEPDASFKIRKLGYKVVFNPKAAIEHRPSILGIFKARPKAFTRSQNFLLFYFRHIRPRRPQGWLRFLVYLGMMNGYWCYKAFCTRDYRPVLGVLGTVVGAIRYAPELFRPRSAS